MVNLQMRQMSINQLSPWKTQLLISTICLHPAIPRHKIIFIWVYLSAYFQVTLHKTLELEANGQCYTDQPIWYDTPESFGVSFGKYFYTTSSSRHAVEDGYTNQFETEDIHANANTYLINQYKNIFTLDYLYLLKSSDNIEFSLELLVLGAWKYEVGSIIIMVMTRDNSAREDFVTYGGGLLYKLNNNYDIKLTSKVFHG